jgi:hypothetical protein
MNEKLNSVAQLICKSSFEIFCEFFLSQVVFGIFSLDSLATHYKVQAWRTFNDRLTLIKSVLYEFLLVKDHRIG